MTIVIDSDTAIKLLEGAVQLRGEAYIYSQPTSGLCFYEFNGTPSCGIGWALSRAGASLETLRVLDRAYDGFPAAIGAPEIPKLLEGQGIQLVGNAQAIFKEFQLSQDRGHTWGTALTEAQQLKQELEA